MSLKKDLTKVVSANVLVMLVNVVVSFVLPKWLSIDDYALFRTFTLYVSFIGILHMGFIDGLNVKFGGVSIKLIDKAFITNSHRFFSFFQVSVAVILTLTGVFSNSFMITLIGLAVIPVNFHTYSMLIYQAAGKFTPYAIGLTLSPLLSLLIYSLLFVAGTEGYQSYALAYLAGYVIVVIFLEVYFRRNFGTSQLSFPKVNISQVKEIFSLGIFVLMGNSLFILFNTMGRWGVKVFLDNTAFAYYSFATSMLGFIILAINSVALTLYPHLSKKGMQANNQGYRSSFLMLGSYSLLAFFIVKLAVNWILPDYRDSLNILMVLMASMPGMLIIKALYLNLYKVSRQTKGFLMDTLKYLVIAILLHGVLFALFRSSISLAVASVISIYIWVFSNTRFIRLEKFKLLKEVFYTLLCIGAYTLISIYVGSVFLGLLALATLVSIVNLGFFRKELFSLIKKISPWQHT